MVFLQTDAGFDIFYDTELYNSNQSALFSGQKMSFFISTADSFFYNYTTVPYDSGSILCFTNAGCKPAKKTSDSISLSTSPYAGSADQYQLLPSSFSIQIPPGSSPSSVSATTVFGNILLPSLQTKTENQYSQMNGIVIQNINGKKITAYASSWAVKNRPVAVVEIFMNEKELPDSCKIMSVSKTTPKNFIVQFDSRLTKWRYFIVNKTDKKVDNLFIDTRNNKIMFVSTGERIILNSTAFVLESKSPIKMQQYPGEDFNLEIRNSGGSILKNIPLPSAETLSTENKTDYIDTYIYI